MRVLHFSFGEFSIYKNYDTIISKTIAPSKELVASVLREAILGSPWI
jgi:hypothetical protein